VQIGRPLQRSRPCLSHLLRLVFTSNAAEQPRSIDRPGLQSLNRASSLMVCVESGVPRNISQAVRPFPAGRWSFDVDDLQDRVNAYQASHGGRIPPAERSASQGRRPKQFLANGGAGLRRAQP